MSEKIYKGKKFFNVLNTHHFDIQRKIVSNMTTESWQNIPHVGAVYEPDVTDFIEKFNQLKADGDLNDISINTLMLRVIVEGIKACPQINGHINFNKAFVTGKIEHYSDINISMPMLLPNGSMMTINLHNFEDKKLTEMNDYISDVRRKLENTNVGEAMFSVSMDNTLTALKKGKLTTVLGRLAGAKIGKHKVKTLSGNAKKEYDKISDKDKIVKEDIEQGTITISNLGSVYRGSNCRPSIIEVIPPQICAVGIGPISENPGVYTVNGKKEIGIRKYMPMLIVFDHRALDFGDVSPFMQKLDEIFATPEIIESL